MPRPSRIPVRRLPRPEPVDFPALLIDLRRHGWTMRGIAQALGVSHGRTQKWLYEGAAPRYEDGLQLILMHQQTTGRNLCQCPACRDDESTDTALPVARKAA